MSLILAALNLYLPPFLKKRRLRQLAELTADAFQCPPPKLSGRSFEERLREYAAFTREQAGKCIERGDTVEATRARLYENARRLGEELRRTLHVRDIEDVMAASKVLYRVLGIEFQGNQQGEVVIPRCFFSSFYSPQICQLISALDEGVAAGLSDGGRLTFHQRITQGRDCCRARFVFPDRDAW
jgi:hypothetical protein